MPCIQSIADAKASFASRVNDGIVTLMACGYSRERATNSLLSELNRGESCTRPSDEEIFVAMKAYNLVIEEATKAIIVSKAMNRALAAASTPTKAIELLSEKISVANLLYDSSDEEIPSDDECSIRPELRVEPVIPVDRQLSSRRRTTSSRRSRVANKTLRPRINKPNMAGRSDQLKILFLWKRKKLARDLIQLQRLSMPKSMQRNLTKKAVVQSPC